MLQPTPARHSPRIWCAAIMLIPALWLVRQQPSPPSLLGRWHGRSICDRAPGNEACHDEEVIYHVAPSPQHPGRVRLDADKVVNGAIIPMGALEFDFDKATDTWISEFRNARVDVLWRLHVTGSRLDGRLEDVPSRRLRRRVSAVRDSV